MLFICYSENIFNHLIVTCILRNPRPIVETSCSNLLREYSEIKGAKTMREEIDDATKEELPLEDDNYKL